MRLLTVFSPIQSFLGRVVSSGSWGVGIGEGGGERGGRRLLPQISIYSGGFGRRVGGEGHPRRAIGCRPRGVRGEETERGGREGRIERRRPPPAR